MPKTRDPAACRLYINARKLWHSKIAWQLTHQEFTSIFHFYRSGLGPLESNHVLDINLEKSVEIVRIAVAAGQAWGYYDLGVAHEQGYGGATQDEQIAWAYYRKAAELGSPEAQMTLAGAYLKAERHDAEEAMVMCAHRQNQGAAAHDLGVTAEVFNNLANAVEYYQAAARFGHQRSAAALMLLFDVEDWNARDKPEQNALKAMEILPDPERKSRYKQISQALNINPDLRLTRLDKVLRLPPAELPAWNGIQDAIEPEPDGPPTY